MTREDRSRRVSRGALAAEHAAAPRLANTPADDYPSVFPAGPGREATDEEFRELFGELETDDEP